MDRELLFSRVGAALSGGCVDGLYLVLLIYGQNEKVWKLRASEYVERPGIFVSWGLQLWRCAGGVENANL